MDSPQVKRSFIPALGVKELLAAVAAHDAATYRHSRRTALYATALAADLDLDPAHLSRVRTAALVHDLGKIGIPGVIVRKPGPLTEGEWDLMRRHSELGATMLADAGMGEIGRWVLHLHERWDGRGYPRGLAGEEIPFESRLLHVADTLEAMTFPRPYRSPLTRDEALAQLEWCAGTQLDTSLVRRLISIVRGTEPGRYRRAAKPTPSPIGSTTPSQRSDSSSSALNLRAIAS